nr:hypothetical protein [Aquihabitans sp. G128]
MAALGVDVGVAHHDVGVLLGQQLDDPAAGRLPVVARGALVGHPCHQDAAALHGALLVVERRDQAADHVVGHVLVDLVGQLDEAEREAEGLRDPPRQVGGVDGRAVAADARTGAEGHEAEGLALGGVDGLPHVDPEVGRTW